MKIFIAGANGRVANFLIRELVSAGHFVIAGVRDISKAPALDGVEPVLLDLHQPARELASLIEGADAVYFTAGSRGKDLLQTDAFGAVKLMQASEQAGIKRFVMLSSVFATAPEKWNDLALEKITNYNIAKFFADQWLINNTDLDYTIIQPGPLVEAEKATGLIQIDVSHSQPNIIPNVAQVLANVLERSNTFKKVITMADGDQPVNEVLGSL